MGVLIRGGTVVTALDRFVGDVYATGGLIAAVGPGIEPAGGDEVIDAHGQYVFPGGVDPHVHLALPVAGTVSADDFESGTAAALAGGTTTVIDFVHPERGEEPLEALAARRAEARDAVADYGFHMAITWWGEGTAAAIRACVAEEGIPSFKTYMAYKGSVGIDDVDLIRTMRAVREAGGLVIVHAEHGDLVEHLRDRFAAAGRLTPKYHALSRPSLAEGEATYRATVLAEATGCPLYVFHVTCREALHAISRARERGQMVFGETCPHYLLLDDSVYDRPGFEGAAYVVAPPIRAIGHQEALWAALGTGMLQVVSTDHCPFTMAQKELGRGDFRAIPGGAAGIEHRLALLYTHGVGRGRIDLHQFVDLVSTRPAKLFGLYPRKGAIAPGSDADLVVWDPAASATISAATHRHRTDRSVFEGFEVVGQPSTVVAAGEIRMRDGELLAEPGCGRYLRRGLGG